MVNPYISDLNGPAPMTPRRLVDDPEAFPREVREFVDKPLLESPYSNTFLSAVARPMYEAAMLWRRVPDAATTRANRARAIEVAGTVGAVDWRMATLEWMWRRQERASGMGAEGGD
jgi:hypothetical protein